MAFSGVRIMGDPGQKFDLNSVASSASRFACSKRLDPNRFFISFLRRIIQKSKPQ